MVIKMKFGVCTGFDNLAKAKEAGFDFIEISAAVINAMTQSQIKDQFKICEENDIFPQAFNCMFQGDIRLTGERFNENQIQEYTKELFYKASGLGIKMSVLGSGNARNVAENDDYEKCMEQLAKTAYIAAENALKEGITVAFEPLRSAETNIIKTVEQAAELCEKVNHKNLKINADFYHMAQENEPFENIIKYAPLIGHIHIANYETRGYPKIGDGFDYNQALSILERAGYDQRVSVEARTENFEADCLDAAKIFCK